jgi:SAM-dependent methyltransferase
VSFEADAAVYDRHVGRYAAQLSAALIDTVRVAPSNHVLDVGCGPGGLTRALVDLVGAENVAAVDPSKSFVAACEARVPGADVREGVAESLPFDDGAFDVVLSQLVVNFMVDADAGLAEMRRVARRGGSVASCVWDYADGMTMLRALWDGALDGDPDAPDEGRTMRYCSEPELRELWRRGGLRDVNTGALVVEAAYDDFDDYWIPFTAGFRTLGRLLRFARCPPAGSIARGRLSPAWRACKAVHADGARVVRARARDLSLRKYAVDLRGRLALVGCALGERSELRAGTAGSLAESLEGLVDADPVPPGQHTFRPLDDNSRVERRLQLRDPLEQELGRAVGLPITRPQQRVGALVHVKGQR